MIESITIQNFAIIDTITVDFPSGMTVLTGQTGAGKSIIIDAIGQLLGNRTQTSFIRSGCSKAFIEGVFDISMNAKVKCILEENDFEIEDQMIVSKTINLDGKTIIKLNYRTINNSLLKLIMSNVIDIHSQFETHRLFDEKNHIVLLDEFIGEPIIALKNTYLEYYQKYTATKKQLHQLIHEEYSDEQCEFYQAQLDEIHEIEIETIDEDSLDNELKSLQNHEKINENITAYKHYMDGDNGTFSNCLQALKQLSTLSDLPEYQEQYDLLYDLYYTMVDRHETLLDLASNQYFDQEYLVTLQTTKHTLQRLKRKYGNTIENVIATRDELQRKIEHFSNREEHIEQLQAQCNEYQRLIYQIGNEITTLRSAKGNEFSKLIKKQLQDLYLPNVQFVVEVSNIEPTSSGIDKVQFLISTNVGQGIKPLHKVSSGGELSRIMLAIKIVSLEIFHSTTIIFDEADSGVSGKVAQSIGKKMSELAKKYQVLCITHLFQVALFANHHFLIEKTNDDSNTVVQISLLDVHHSEEELAKMISGTSITEESLQHVRSLKIENNV